MGACHNVHATVFGLSPTFRTGSEMSGVLVHFQMANFLTGLFSLNWDLMGLWYVEV